MRAKPRRHLNLHELESFVVLPIASLPRPNAV